MSFVRLWCYWPQLNLEIIISHDLLSGADFECFCWERGGWRRISESCKKFGHDFFAIWKIAIFSPEGRSLFSKTL